MLLRAMNLLRLDQATRCLRAFIPLPRAEQPPQPDNYRQTTPDQTRVVHALRIRRQEVRERVYHEPNHQVRTRQTVHHKTNPSFHPERPIRDSLPTVEEVRQNRGDVRAAEEQDRGADECIERSRAADVDAPEDRHENRRRHRCVPGHVQPVVNLSENTRERRRAVPGQGPEGPARRDEQPDHAEADVDHDEGQHAARAGRAPRGLLVDLGDGVRRLGDDAQVVDGVHDSHEVAKSSNKANSQLQGHPYGDVPLRVGDLLRQVRDDVHGADAVRAVEHARDEDEPVRVPQRLRPLLPDEGAGGVRRAAVVARHGRHDDDGDEEAGQDGEDADLVEVRHRRVGEAHGGAPEPGRDDVDDEDVPRLRHERRVVERVHLHDGVAEDGGHAGAAHRPGEVVPPAGEEADGAPVPRPRRHGRPVVDAARAGDRGAQLRQAGRDEEVEEGHHDELVQHPGRPAVGYRHEDGAADRGPGVPDRDPDACERDEVEAPRELLGMAGRVDQDTGVVGCGGAGLGVDGGRVFEEGRFLLLGRPHFQL